MYVIVLLFIFLVEKINNKILYKMFIKLLKNYNLINDEIQKGFDYRD